VNDVKSDFQDGSPGGSSDPQKPPGEAIRGRSERAEQPAFQELADDPLVDWFEERGTPEQLEKLDAALAAATLEFGEITRDRTGQMGYQKFRYTPLSTLTGATKPQLAKHGINVSQLLCNSPRSGAQHRLVLRVSGHGARIIACLDFTPRGNIQEYGKYITYIRRYQYQAWGVLDGERDVDDDGSEMGAPTQQRDQRRR
jgi:ERF superfamily